MNFLPPKKNKPKPSVKGVAKPLGMKRPGGGVNPIEVDTIEPPVVIFTHPTLVGRLSHVDLLVSCLEQII